jgi:ABC-type multidrug transport system fused ATPase/permease subunit
VQPTPTNGTNLGGNDTIGNGVTGKPEPYYMRLSFLVPILGCIVIIQMIAALAFEAVHARWVRVDMSVPMPSMNEQRRIPVSAMFNGFPRLVTPYFTSPRGVRGRLCVVAILVIGLIGLFTSYVHNSWQKEWWDLFSKTDSKRFLPIMSIFIVLVCAHMLTAVYSEYVRAWLYIDWREFMTRDLMRRWFSGHTHFLLQLEQKAVAQSGADAGNATAGGAKRVDNPDQRIQEDVHLFVINTMDICVECFHSVGQIFVFVPIVIMLEPKKAFGMYAIPGWLLIAAVCYSAIGAACTHLIGWPLVRTSFARQRYEADFRHLALHVRDNSESVALYNSEASEEENMRMQFENIKRMQWQSMVLNKRLTFFSSAYGFMQFLVPFFILAPSYFAKQISLGDLFQLTGAVGHVCHAFDWFLKVYGSLTDWRATADRLISFEDAIEKVQPQAAHANASLKFNGGGNHPSDSPGKEILTAEPVSPSFGKKCTTDMTGCAVGSMLASIVEVKLPTGITIWRARSIFRRASVCSSLVQRASARASSSRPWRASGPLWRGATFSYLSRPKTKCCSCRSGQPCQSSAR